MQKAMGFNNIAFVYIKKVLIEFIFGIWVKMMQFYLIKEVLYNFFFWYFFLLCIKIGEKTNLTYYKKKRDVVLSKAKHCYKNNKDILREKARDKYRNLSEEEKI